MSERFKSNKVVFRKGTQKKFLQEALRHVSVDNLARLCSLSTRTIRDWKREKFRMDSDALEKICHTVGIQRPENVRFVSRFEHTARAGKKGAVIIMKKYGRIPVNEMIRKKKWKEWWGENGRKKETLGAFMTPKSIKTPKPSVELAEFFGAMMGDGGISQYQAKITLHHIDDLAYCKYLVRQIEKLFGVRPSVYHTPKDSVNDIVISRRELVQYLHKKGLPIGNKVKQQFDIPVWIKRNPTFATACIRGLIDTDGTVFTHKYRVNGKQYAYKKMAFCSRSRPLQLSAAAIIASIGIRARLSRYEVRIDSKDDVKKYFSIVGSSNPKHLERYHDSSTMHRTGEVRRMVSQRFAKP